MSKQKQIPHNWEGTRGIEEQLRELIIAQASIIAAFGPAGSEAYDAFLGISGLTLDTGAITDDEKSNIEIKRHGIYRLVRHAYEYAYQLDGYRNLSADDIYEIECGVLNGYPQTDMHGEPTGLSKLDDQPLRLVIETCCARWHWSIEGDGLTVRELSLLANLGEPTVRSSISKEGFRLEAQVSNDVDDARSKLSAGDSSQWLARRRGFIPNRDGMSSELRTVLISEILECGESYFPNALERICELSNITLGELSKMANLQGDWFDGLLGSRAIEIDLAALKRLANALGADRVSFVGKAVQHLLRLEAD